MRRWAMLHGKPIMEPCRQTPGQSQIMAYKPGLLIVWTTGSTNKNTAKYTINTTLEGMVWVMTKPETWTRRLVKERTDLAREVGRLVGSAGGEDRLTAASR